MKRTRAIGNSQHTWKDITVQGDWGDALEIIQGSAQINGEDISLYAEDKIERVLEQDRPKAKGWVASFMVFEFQDGHTWLYGATNEPAEICYKIDQEIYNLAVDYMVLSFPQKRPDTDPRRKDVPTWLTR